MVGTVVGSGRSPDQAIKEAPAASGRGVEFFSPTAIRGADLPRAHSFLRGTAALISLSLSLTATLSAATIVTALTTATPALADGGNGGDADGGAVAGGTGGRVDEWR